jgi:uncharacterized protein (TIGR01244 family)
MGFKTVVNNRPDGEGGADQPTSAMMEAAAHAAGLIYDYLPVISGQITEQQAKKFAELLATRPAPLLAFCRSGARSQNLNQLASNGSSGPRLINERCFATSGLAENLSAPVHCWGYQSQQV